VPSVRGSPARSMKATIALSLSPVFRFENTIARDPAVSLSTVVTYRRRACEKLGSTTQKGPFGLFLQRVRSRPRPG